MDIQVIPSAEPLTEEMVERFIELLARIALRGDTPPEQASEDRTWADGKNFRNAASA